MSYSHNFFKIPWIFRWSYILDPLVANDFKWVANLEDILTVKWRDKFNDTYITENIEKSYTLTIQPS